MHLALPGGEGNSNADALSRLPLSKLDNPDVIPELGEVKMIMSALDNSPATAL